MTLKDLHAFETGLDPHPANFVPLSPVSFLNRAASAFADKVAVIDGPRSFTYAQLLDRCIRLASALTTLGVGRLDTVAIIASNIPEMIEAHFAVPMLGAAQYAAGCVKYRLLAHAWGRQGSDRRW